MYHGDHQQNRQGFPVLISGAEELFQRACIRLTVPLGRFIPDKNLGSRLYTLGRAAPEQRQELALEYAREALIGMEDIRVVSARIFSGEDQAIEIIFSLEYAGTDQPEECQILWGLNH